MTRTARPLGLPGRGRRDPVYRAGFLGAQEQGWQLLTAGAFVTMVIQLLVFHLAAALLSVA